MLPEAVPETPVMLNDDDEVKRKRYKKLAVTHSTKMKDGRVVRKRTAHRQPLAEDARKRSRFCGPLQAPRWQKDGVETRFMRRHCRQGLAVRDEESPAGYGGALPHRAWLTFLLDPAKYWVLFHWDRGSCYANVTLLTGAQDGILLSKFCCSGW